MVAHRPWSPLPGRSIRQSLDHSMDVLLSLVQMLPGLTEPHPTAFGFDLLAIRAVHFDRVFCIDPNDQVATPPGPGGEGRHITCSYGNTIAMVLECHESGIEVGYEASDRIHGVELESPPIKVSAVDVRD